MMLSEHGRAITLMNSLQPWFFFIRPAQDLASQYFSMDEGNAHDVPPLPLGALDI